MLVFACPSCGAKLQMPDELAGKKVRCGSCQAVITAPAQGEGSDAITASPASVSPPASTAVAPGEKASRSGTDGNADDNDRGPWRDGSGSATATTAAATGLGIGAIVLIVLGVLAVCLCVPGILIALLVPAVQKVREAAARTQTTNNMRQVALAIHNYNDVHRQLPTPKALVPPQHMKSTELSWRVSILPFIEQNNLFNQFDMNSAWDSPRNQGFMNSMPPVYVHLNREQQGKPGTQTLFQYFTGPGTVWPDNNARALFPGAFPDGTSNTFLFAEAANPVPWTKPADMAIQPGGALPLPPTTFLAALADGSVRQVDRRRTTDATLLLYINPKDGMPVPPLD